jgi:hypothetical protein
MNYAKLGIATVAAVALCSLTATAAHANGVINLAPLQPTNPGWGQTTQFTFYVSENGKPTPKTKVVVWFSGQRGIKSDSRAYWTDDKGRVTFTRSLPQWKQQSKWVDLNVSCDQVAVLKYWRIK